MAVAYFGLHEIYMDQQTQIELEAAAFRSLVTHLDNQNARHCKLRAPDPEEPRLE
jgi:hypothetical protein